MLAERAGKTCAVLVAEQGTVVRSIAYEHDLTSTSMTGGHPKESEES